MLVKTEGIVIRSVKYSESSLICKIYTRELGMQSYIVNGVRGKSKGSARAPLLQAASILHLEVYHREHKNLQRIREFTPAHIFQRIPSDVKRGSMALFLMEVSNKTLMDESENREAFELLKSSLLHIDLEEKVANFHLYFLIRLSQILGFGPQFPHGVQTFFNLREGIFQSELPGHPDFAEEKSSAFLARLMQANHVTEVEAGRHERKALLAKLLRYYELHLDHFRSLRSHSILNTVFSETDD